MNRLICSFTQSFLHRPSTSYTTTLKHIQSFIIKPINYKICSQLFHTGKALKYCSNSVTPSSASSSIDGTAKLVKDVIVFKYENPKFFKYLNIFAICQFLCWNYLANFSFTSLRDAPVEPSSEDLPWWRSINLGENKYRNALTILCFLVGYGILAISWLYILRSVRFLVLRKGGVAVTLVTYTPFGKNRMMTVPLKCISAQQSRSQAKVQLPLKVKDKSFYYILDMRGEFLNQRLYDFTIGLKRRF